MERGELCEWLRANSAGIYRPAAEAATEIEVLARKCERLLGMLREARDTIDTLPGYPKGADLCDRIDVELGEAVPHNKNTKKQVHRPHGPVNDRLMRSFYGPPK